MTLSIASDERMSSTFSVLFIGLPTLNNGSLFDYLTKQTELSVNWLKQWEDSNTITTMHQHRLILLDCRSLSYDSICMLTRYASKSPTPCHIALLNMPQNAQYEGLIETKSIFGIFYENTAIEELVEGLRVIRGQGVWLPRQLLVNYLMQHRENDLEAQQQSIIEKLTPREKQILTLTTTGATNSDIAKQLELSAHTVKSHMYNLFKKIGVSNRLQASNWAKSHIVDSSSYAELC